MNPKNQSSGPSFLHGQAYWVRIKHLLTWLKEIPSKLLNGIRKIRYADLVIIVIGICLAILLRYSLLTFKSGDYSCCIKDWYEIIRMGGVSVFRYGFSNYPPLYLYCLYVVSKILPHLSTVYAVRLPPIVADFVCALFVFCIVRLKFNRGPIPLFSFFAVLFAPTVVLNSSLWGQTDSLHSAALVASIYFLLTRRNWLACLAYGLAFAFKLQAIFLAPFFLALFLKQKVSWQQLLLIPIVYLVTIYPAWMVGRPLSELLTIYAEQTSMFEFLTLNAPTMYAWLPERLFHLFSTAGIFFAACIAFMYVIVIYKSRTPITGPLMVQFATISVILIPFVLPRMHERYFFAADVISLAFAFYFPRYFYIPIVINLVSFFSYQQFLFGVKPIPDSILAIALLTVIIILVRHLMMTLFQKIYP